MAPEPCTTLSLHRHSQWPHAWLLQEATLTPRLQGLAVCRMWKQMFPLARGKLAWWRQTSIIDHDGWAAAENMKKVPVPTLIPSPLAEQFQPAEATENEETVCPCSMLHPPCHRCQAEHQGQRLGEQWKLQLPALYPSGPGDSLPPYLAQASHAYSAVTESPSCYSIVIIVLCVYN